MNPEIRLLKKRHFEDVNRRFSGSGKSTLFDRNFPTNAPHETHRAPGSTGTRDFTKETH